MESAPRNIQVRPLSSSTMVVTWEPPETPNGQITVKFKYWRFLDWKLICKTHQLGLQGLFHHWSCPTWGLLGVSGGG